MSVLHTIARAPDSGLLDACVPVLNPGDAILFIEDGVYHCLAADWLSGYPKACRVLGLREDIQARGLKERCAEQIEIVGTKKFVQLCCDFDKVVNWF